MCYLNKVQSTKHKSLKFNKIDCQKSECVWITLKFIQELMKSLSHSPTILWISSLTLENLFLTMETVITFLVVPQAAPKAFFDGTNTYGTF